MQKGGKSAILSAKVKVVYKGLFVDRLKQLCLLTGIALLMVLAAFCIIGSAMGVDWSKWFFNTLPGGGLWVCLGLLIIAGLFEFKEVCPHTFTETAAISLRQRFFCWCWDKGVGVYKTKWPLVVYAGALLVLAAGLINCGYAAFAGFILGCIGLFGLLWTRPYRVDVIIAVLLFLVVVFIFSFLSLRPQLKSVFFVPHVFVCLLSYVFFAKAAFFAVKYFFDGMLETEKKSYRLVCMAFPLLTAGIAVGSAWAAFAWGQWWSWDPKETFSLAIWLVFAAFLHFRYLYRQRFLRLNSIWIICGFILIVLSLLLVNFSKVFAGLHSHSS